MLNHRFLNKPKIINLDFLYHSFQHKTMLHLLAF